MNNYLTALELGQRLQVGRQTVLYHIHQGHIAAEKHGRDYAIPEAEADRVALHYRRHASWVKPGAFAEVQGD